MNIKTSVRTPSAILQRIISILAKLSLLVAVAGLLVSISGRHYRDQLLQPYTENIYPSPVFQDGLTGHSSSGFQKGNRTVYVKEVYTVNGEEIVITDPNDEELEPQSLFNFKTWLDGSDIESYSGTSSTSERSECFTTYRLPFVSYLTLPNGFIVQFDWSTERILDPSIVDSIDNTTNIIKLGAQIFWIAAPIFTALAAILVILFITRLAIKIKRNIHAYF